MDMNREKKLRYNTIMALFNQIITVIYGLLLPGFFLKCYGSQVYGLSTSISQFLGVVTLMELGIGAVVQSSLYTPLAKKNVFEISKIVVSAEKFFRKVASVFGGYILILVFVYPIYIQDAFEWWYEASLIIIIAISSMAEYFFGITYKLLLSADQKAYIPLGLQSMGLVLSAIFSIILMQLGAEIHIVKLVSAVVLLIRPVFQNMYVKQHYSIVRKIEFQDEPIKQKWNGVAQHLAYYVTNSTDTIILTVFSTLENVSIYAVYNMVINGIKQLVLTLGTGMQAMCGNLIANKEMDELSIKFKHFEWQIHNIVTVLFTCTGILIVPFVTIYTYDITDANYIQPIFAILLTLAQALYCIRLPYNIIVCAAGHYKQTQTSAILEMVINLGITITLVQKWGLVGVAIGTLLALAYRTCYLAYYLTHNILSYKIKSFLKCVLMDILIVVCTVYISYHFEINSMTYFSWFFYAIKVFLCTLVVAFVINYIFERRRIIGAIKSAIHCRNF